MLVCPNLLDYLGVYSLLKHREAADAKVKAAIAEYRAKYPEDAQKKINTYNYNERQLLHHRQLRPGIILTTSSNGGGVVTSPGQPGPYYYIPGTGVSLLATPNTGYAFVNWSGSTGTIANVNASSTTITMNGNYSVTANFVMQPNTVYIGNMAPISKGNQFTAIVNINQGQNLAYAAFDIQFNRSLISYASIAPGNISGLGIAPVVSSNIVQPGLLRVVVDLSDYANANSGNGLTGSGSLCSVTFNALAAGTGNISFVAGQGAPTGELTMIKFASYSPSTLSSNWLNNQIVITSP